MRPAALSNDTYDNMKIRVYSISGLTKSVPLSCVSRMWLIAVPRYMSCRSLTFALASAISRTVARMSVQQFTPIYCVRALWLRKRFSVAGILSSTVFSFYVIMTVPSCISTSATPLNIVGVFSISSDRLDWKFMDSFSSLSKSSLLSTSTLSSTGSIATTD